MQLEMVLEKIVLFFPATNESLTDWPSEDLAMILRI